MVTLAKSCPASRWPVARPLSNKEQVALSLTTGKNELLRLNPRPMADSDLDQLLNALLGMAEMLLGKQGTFLPIGAIMLSDGEIRHVGAQIEGEEYPGAQPLIEVLTENIQREATEGKLRAAGIAYDALTVPPGKHQKQDAICCGLEHCLGEAVYVFRPYVKTEEGSFRCEEIFVTNRTQQFFCQLPRSAS
jgi:hypothetical protein